MSCGVTEQVGRKGVIYLTIITAGVTNAVTGIVVHVRGFCAWRTADLARVPVLLTVSFPIGAVPMAVLAQKAADTAR